MNLLNLNLYEVQGQFGIKLDTKKKKIKIPIANLTKIRMFQISQSS